MVLYMLKCTKSPISNADISDYILEKGYTDALKLQSSISELVMEEMIIALPKHNRTYYELLTEGRNTIDALESRISEAIRKDIYTYLYTNASRLSEKHSLTAEVIQNENDYSALLNAYDKNGTLFTINMTFPTEALAKNACENFKTESKEIYETLIKRLMK